MNKTLLIIFLLVVHHYCVQIQGQSQSQGQNSNTPPQNKPSKNSIPPATTTTPSKSNNSTNSISNTATTAPTTPTAPIKSTTATNSSTSGNSANSATTTTSTTSSTSSNSATNQAPASQTASNSPSTPWFAAKLLNLHNIEKTLINQANYTWSDSLYKSAQSWADYLASSYQFYHSGTGGVGENIATATIRDTDMVTMMFGFWSAEKKYFMPWKRFPDCSTTGNWGDVAHYTQIVWGMSTEVGCGLGINTYNNVLVCQYSLPGNYIGNYVYLNVTSSN